MARSLAFSGCATVQTAYRIAQVTDAQNATYDRLKRRIEFATGYDLICSRLFKGLRANEEVLHSVRRTISDSQWFIEVRVP